MSRIGRRERLAERAQRLPGVPAVAAAVADDDDDGGYAREALRAFREALSSSDSRHSSTTLVEMREGIDGWLKRYTPGGAPRPRYVGYGKDNEETMFTASN